MIAEKRLKKNLKYQFIMINDIDISLHYLINYEKYFEDNGKEKLQDLNFIYKVIRDQTIINLYKLFHNGKEDYSFNNEHHSLSHKKSLFNEIKNEKRIKEFYSIRKKANKLFKILNIYEIRNEHVGHLDVLRNTKSVNWEEVKKLNNYACQMHDNINLVLFNNQSPWGFQKDLLEFTLKKDLIHKKLFQIWRNACRNVNEKISISEIKDLLHLKL